MLVTVAFRTLFQASVAPEDLGRVMSVRLALAQLTRPISLVAAAVVMAVADPRAAVVFFAAVLVVAAGLIGSAPVCGKEPADEPEPQPRSAIDHRR
jgi:hypothetical protein